MVFRLSHTKEEIPMREQDTLKAVVVDDLVRLLHRLGVFNVDQYAWRWLPGAFGGEGVGVPVRITRVDDGTRDW